MRLARACLCAFMAAICSCLVVIALEQLPGYWRTVTGGFAYGATGVKSVPAQSSHWGGLPGGAQEVCMALVYLQCCILSISSSQVSYDQT